MFPYSQKELSVTDRGAGCRTGLRKKATFEMGRGVDGETSVVRKDLGRAAVGNNKKDTGEKTIETLVVVVLLFWFGGGGVVLGFVWGWGWFLFLVVGFLGCLGLGGGFVCGGGGGGCVLGWFLCVVGLWGGGGGGWGLWGLLVCFFWVTLIRGILGRNPG